MKNSKILFAIVSIFIILTYIFNSLNVNAIVLPDSKNIVKIEILANNNMQKHANVYNVSKFIDDIKNNTKGTNIQSINDNPNQSNYYIIKFFHKENGTSIAYAYKKKNTCYIEQPYTGVWILKKDIYNNIEKLIN